MRKTPEEIWSAALEDDYGIKVIDCDPAALEKELFAYRKDKPELFGFYLVKKKDELWIVRARNVSGVRLDGDYRPMEE